MRRLLTCGLAVSAALLASGCGSEDVETDPTPRDDAPAVVDEPGAVPPPGEGVDRDEAQDHEEPIVVGGLHYDPLLARRLNPNIAPDEALVSGRAPPEGKIWFGVFLRVCNRGDRTRTPSERLALVDAFGRRTRPSGVLAAENPFAYRPSALQAGDCLPRPGSIAERNDGALVLFAVSPELLEDRPVALEVDDERVVLDV